MIDGEAVIIPPEDFQLVAAEEGLNVQVTPKGNSKGLYIEKKSINEIIIRENNDGKSNLEFDYFISGIRKGFEGHKPIQENTHFKPKGTSDIEFEKRYSGNSTIDKVYRELLIKNGILTPDGKINTESPEVILAKQ